MQSTVFVVDDNAEIRDLLKDIGATIHLPVETFACAGDFLDSYMNDRAGCLVTDVRMPQMSGLDLHSRLRQMGMRIPVIFITGHAEVPLVVQAFKGGAVDFIEKPFSHYDIISSIQHALKLDAMMRKESLARSCVEEGLGKLTRREREVLDILVTGRSSRLTAKDLGISIKTVDFHRTNILSKMETNSLIELARYLR